MTEESLDIVESELENEEISIPAPVEPDVNPTVYRDVEDILFQGFLHIKADFNGTFFVFKSLNHQEMKLLKFSQTSDSTSREFWGLFLAYSVFMIDGNNILPERERWIKQIASMFYDMNQPIQTEVIRRLSELNRRATISVPMTEAYVLEKQSRFRWLQLKGLDLTSCQVTGVEGTQKLGLNWAQYLWRGLNQLEDRNEAYEAQWENAKFVGSCFAGKGVQKVYNRDTERRNRERQDRMDRKDRILRTNVLGEKLPEFHTEFDGSTIMIARTERELAQQVESSLRGEKDWHDKIVDQHENRIEAAYQDRMTALEENQKLLDKKYQGRRLLTKEEIQSTPTHPVLDMDSKSEKVIRKHLIKK